MYGMWLCMPPLVGEIVQGVGPKEKLKIFGIWGNPPHYVSFLLHTLLCFFVFRKSLSPLLSNGEIASAPALGQSPLYTPTAHIHSLLSGR